MRNITTPRRVTKLGTMLALGWAMGGCGYEPVYGAGRPEVRLSVAAAPYATPYVAAVQAAVTGVRRSLSGAGVLRPGGGFPRVVVEVVRVDERASGLQATELAGGERVPLGRGSAVGVVGRAWVEEADKGPRTRDTGDVRRVEYYASAGDPRLEQIEHEQAVRAAAHALGQALGRRILGDPETTLEPL